MLIQKYVANDRSASFSFWFITPPWYTGWYFQPDKNRFCSCQNRMGLGPRAEARGPGVAGVSLLGGLGELECGLVHLNPLVGG